MRKLLQLAITTALVVPLAACGGGGGGSGGPSSTPTPPPPPPPPPPPLAKFPAVFPSVTATTDFAALGYEYFRGVGGAGQTELRDNFAVRYDAAAQAYVIDLPSAPAGRFEAGSQDASYWRGYLLDQPVVSPSMDIRKPDSAGFVYTTFGDYYQYEWAPVDFFDGVFAFGLATPAGAVPTTGSASYSALLAGTTADWYTIEGTASLQFNFGAGTLSGSMNPILVGMFNPVPLGRYDFVNTIYSVGATSFSGGLRHEGGNLTGSFNGLFTGPAAQELMARWRAQYARPDNSGTISEMVGVLVGKRP
ncbi:transferrin-binding protein-like solute binding protein [Sphingomonas mesophila]|uniref:transferrin-binding protein-like solute binding protein n=1 Tax=Sphingomonas mesophila TaxID=2303576 RepID=UPI0013C2D52E|nr:transferrin-binding protein-like solute binding protein [Sphingomonas mesophila]